MDARLLHFVHAHDGALKLAFNRPVIIHLLREIGRAQVRTIEQFVADASALGDAGRSHLQAQFRNPPRGDQNRRVLVAKSIFRGGFLQFREHGPRIFRRQAGIQRLEIAFVVPLRKRVQRGNRQRGNQDEADALAD